MTPIIRLLPPLVFAALSLATPETASAQTRDRRCAAIDREIAALCTLKLVTHVSLDTIFGFRETIEELRFDSLFSYPDGNIARRARYRTFLADGAFHITGIVTDLYFTSNEVARLSKSRRDPDNGNATFYMSGGKVFASENCDSSCPAYEAVDQYEEYHLLLEDGGYCVGWQTLPGTKVLMYCLEGPNRGGTTLFQKR